jgi:hypothetical protein
VLRLERNHEASGVEPFVDLRSVDFSFLERLEEINLGEVPAVLAGLIESFESWYDMPIRQRAVERRCRDW